jgi:hypothetical protein
VNSLKIILLFTQNIVAKFSKIWVWDPDPEKTYSGFQILDPGSFGQKGTGSRICNTAFYPYIIKVLFV